MSKSVKNFPSIAEMVNETIADTRKMFWRLFKWSLLSLVLIIGAFVISGIVFALGFALIQVTGTFFAIEEGTAAFIPYAVGSAALLIALAIGAILTMVASMFLPTIGTYLIVQEYPKKSTWRSLIAQSARKIAPVIIASLVVAPLVIFGYIFFIIPGVLISLWVSFATFLVILKDMKPWAAVRRSIAIWQTYGNQIFVRILAVVAVSAIAQNVPQVFFSDANNPSVLIVFGVLFMVLSILVQVWTYVFMVRLFQAADKLTPENTKPNMRRFYLLSLPGMIMLTGLLIWGVSFLRSEAGQEWAQREFVDEVSEQTDDATPSAEYDFELE